VKEILYGIYNTRSGHTNTAVFDLKNMVQNELHGDALEFGLGVNAEKAPLNWVLSNTSIKNIKVDVDSQIASNAKLQKLFCFDTLTCKRCK
jgi:hypothetical protein